MSECIITYDGAPTYSVSIMEFAHDHVMHETQYFVDPFGAPEWRMALSEAMPGEHNRSLTLVRVAPSSRSMSQTCRAIRVGLHALPVVELRESAQRRQVPEQLVR